MRKINLKKSIGLFVIALLVIGIAYVVYIVKTLPDFKAGKILTKPSSDYLNLFKDSTRGKLVAHYVLKPEYDSTICKYLYDNNDYVIQEYAINVTNDKTLPELIEVSDKNELNINNTFNSQIGCDLFTMNYKTIFPAVNDLKISLYGSKIETVVKNDTTLLIHSNIKNASVKSGNSDKSIIFCKTDEDLLPVEFLFIKRKRLIYFLMMSINHEKLNLPPGILYTLIK